MTVEQSKEFIDMGHALDNGRVELLYVLEWLESRVDSISLKIADKEEMGEDPDSPDEYQCDIDLPEHSGYYTSWGATRECAVVHCLTGMTV